MWGGGVGVCGVYMRVWVYVRVWVLGVGMGRAECGVYVRVWMWGVGGCVVVCKGVWSSGRAGCGWICGCI